MKKIVLVAVVLAALACSAVIWSQGRPGPAGPPRIGCPATATMPPQAAMLDRLADALALTEDQAAQLKDVLEASDATIPPLVETAGESCKALREALFATDYDAAQVAELATKAESAEAAIVTASIDVWTQIRSILRADQIAALQEVMSAPPPGPRPGGRPGPPPSR